MSENTVISVNGLTVKYKDLIAVNNISFEVMKGEIFGIIGPNGAGKTSTIECLEGLKKQAEAALMFLESTLPTAESYISILVFNCRRRHSPIA